MNRARLSISEKEL